MKKTCVVIVLTLTGLLLPTAAAAAPLCFGKQATLVGSDAPEELRGTDGPDVIYGAGGADVIDAGGGDDLICAGAGTPFENRDDEFIVETVYGGEGNDRIDGGRHTDALLGGYGRDLLLLGPGHDHGVGGPDDDTVRGGAGSDSVGFSDSLGSMGSSGWTAYQGTGEPGDDVFRGGSGDDFIGIGSGRDRINGGPGRNQVSVYSRAAVDVTVDIAQGEVTGFEGDVFTRIRDVTAASRGNVTILGDEGPNALLGGASAEGAGTTRFDGRGGADLLIAVPAMSLGETAHGVFVGGEGDDTLQPGCRSTATFIDRLLGGPGDDVIGAGCNAPSDMSGGPGNDIMVAPGSGGADTADGGDGFDYVSYSRTENGDHVEVDLSQGTARIVYPGGASRVATLSGIEGVEGSEHGADVIVGDDGPNVLLGSVGRPGYRDGGDVISGEGGDDMLAGGDGNDQLDGGAGNDEIDGGDGIDICRGGETLRRCE